MSKIPDRCITAVKDPHIVIEEKRSKITFDNPLRKQYHKIKVDGCVFSSADGEKCDWLLQSIEHHDQYFVELKGSGSNATKAVHQIAATLEKLQTKKEGAKCMAFIIFANSSPRANTERQIIEKKYKNKGIKLIFMESGCHYILNR